MYILYITESAWNRGAGWRDTLLVHWDQRKIVPVKSNDIVSDGRKGDINAVGQNTAVGMEPDWSITDEENK